jgi:tetratricopeptide (TPR) repeat protein
MGKYQLALKEFNKAITLTSNPEDAWFAIADLEYSIGNLQESISNYLKAVELNNNNFNSWYKLAETYIEIGMWLEGLKAFDECIRINNAHATSYYGKAKINFLLGHTQDAIDCLKKAFELDPNIRNEFTKDYPEVKTSKLFIKLLDENKS